MTPQSEMIILLPLFMAVLAQTCHPECHWACDDPVCPASCTPVCLPPQCEICLNNTGTPICRPTRQCYIHCPSDECESDSCPVCEVRCPDQCHNASQCLIQCEEVECAWRCTKPRNCPKPVCELQCELPACVYSDAVTHGVSLSTVMALATLFVMTIVQ